MPLQSPAEIAAILAPSTSGEGETSAVEAEVVAARAGAPDLASRIATVATTATTASDTAATAQSTASASASDVITAQALATAAQASATAAQSSASAASGAAATIAAEVATARGSHASLAVALARQGGARPNADAPQAGITTQRWDFADGVDFGSTFDPGSTLLGSTGVVSAHSALRLSQGAGTGHRNAGRTLALPGDTGVRFTAKAWLSGSDVTAASFALGLTNLTALWVARYYLNGSGSRGIHRLNYTAWNTSSTGDYNFQFYIASNTIYLRKTKVAGGQWETCYSFDGLGWVRMTDSAMTPGHTPTHLFVGANIANSAAGSVWIDWITLETHTSVLDWAEPCGG